MFNSALNIVYDEHRSLAAVVQGLRHLIREYRSGAGAPEFGLLRAILHYLEEFPRKLHHPKEEVYLFVRLQERTRIADSIIAELRAQHAADAWHLDILKSSLERFAAGTPGAGEEFSAAVDRFADDILRHMALEESALIPLARRHLSGEDWVEIGVAFGVNGDPRFVADAEHNFADLFSRIMALAPPAADRKFGPD